MLGTLDNIVQLSAVDATYRLWVGAASPASAPFRVEKTGALTATQATITGTITADAGEIGGWAITTGTLESVSGGVGIVLDSATPRIQVGDTSGAHIVLDGANNQVGSSNFNSGVRGWRVEGNGDAEFNNIVARGVIRTPVFLKDEITAVGGTFLVAESDALAADCTTPANIGDSFTFQAEHNYFAVDDVVRCKPDGTRQFWATITAVSGTGPYTYTATLEDGNTSTTFYKGEAVVNYGPSGQGLVLLTNSLANAPYISIFTHAGAPWSSQTERARLGKLDGITDPYFGSLSGYGLWTDNGYFTGAVRASSGEIGGWTIESTKLKGGNVELRSAGVIHCGVDPDSVYMSAVNTTYRLWIGDADPTVAPFRVEKTGALTATQADITGTITADAGEIGGWTISSTKLTGGNLELRSAGVIQCGVDPDSLYISAVNADYRLWIGDYDPSSAPFRVTKGGQLIATGVDITGNILASSGELGDLSVTGTLSLSGTGKLITAASPNPRIELTTDLLAGYSDGTTKEFWISAADGKAYFAGGGAILSKDGIEITGNELKAQWTCDATSSGYRHAIFSRIYAANPSYSYASLWGLLGAAQSSSQMANSINALGGVRGYTLLQHNYGVSTARGLYGQVYVYDGAANEGVAVQAYIEVDDQEGNTSAKIGTAYLFRGCFYNYGTINYAYGLLIPPLSAKYKTYAIAQQGSGDLNLFEGPIEARNEVKARYDSSEQGYFTGQLSIYNYATDWRAVDHGSQQPSYSWTWYDLWYFTYTTTTYAPERWFMIHRTQMYTLSGWNRDYRVCFRFRIYMGGSNYYVETVGHRPVAAGAYWWPSIVGFNFFDASNQNGSTIYVYLQGLVESTAIQWRYTHFACLRYRR